MTLLVETHEWSLLQRVQQKMRARQIQLLREMTDFDWVPKDELDPDSTAGDSNLGRHEAGGLTWWTHQQ